MKTRRIKVDVEWSNKNFVATLGRNVPGIVVVTAKNYSQLQNKVKESLDFHITGLIESGEQIPEWLCEKDYDFRWCFLDTASLLQSTESMTTIAAICRVTGINERLLSHYANGIKRPSAKQRKKILDGIHLIGSLLLKIG